MRYSYGMYMSIDCVLVRSLRVSWLNGRYARRATPKRAPIQPVNPVKPFNLLAAELAVLVLEELVAEAELDEELESMTLSKADSIAICEFTKVCVDPFRTSVAVHVSSELMAQSNCAVRTGPVVDIATSAETCVASSITVS